MKQILSGFIAVSILVFFARCSQTDDNASGRAAYGHSSASFAPFVKIMEQMDRDIAAVQSENDADRDFAKLMYTYHAAAIAMADIEAREGEDTAMIKIASETIQNRVSDTVILSAFLRSGMRGFATDSFMAESIRLPAEGNLEMQSRQGRIDVAFASMMRLHQQRVMRTVGLYKKYGAADQMLKMAGDILSQNLREAGAINRWLTDKIGHA